MADLVPIHRDFTALVPDGDVNRHCSVTLAFDPDSGAVYAEPALGQARVSANLPAEPAPAAHDDTPEG